MARGNKGTKIVDNNNVLLSRRLEGLGIDLLWDGQHVVMNLGHQNKPIVGLARGVRTATEVMNTEEDKLHNVCCAMEMQF